MRMAYRGRRLDYDAHRSFWESAYTEGMSNCVLSHGLSQASADSRKQKIATPVHSTQSALDFAAELFPIYYKVSAARTRPMMKGALRLLVEAAILTL